jgi:hypothetical protein
MSMFPYNLKAYAASLGIPQGPHSKVFLVDTEHGDDASNGTTWETPLLTLEAAEAKCTTNKHDAVLFLARATADNPAATIAWDKSYTHLVGVGCELPGMGQRCRVVNAAATVMHGPVITFSGNGCMIKNMQFGNEHAAGTATGVVLVTGQRNLFKNVFFMVPFATDAASYSLKITDGGENYFEDCTIGQHTCVRTADTLGLWIALGAGEANPTRNKFKNCQFLSWSSHADHALVKIDADITSEVFTLWFDDCSFVNLGTDLGHIIIDGCTTTDHLVILRGQNFMKGATATHVAATVTYVYSGAPAAAAQALAVVTAN